jgi:tetratricopeptide (TPR) repeat protein
MSKKQEHDPLDDVVVDVEEVYSKTEEFIENNKKSLSVIVGAIVILIGLYLAYSNFYQAPRESEAKANMFAAEQFFAKDSFNLAINGDGVNYYGFLDIIENYSGTKAANLANYYVGVSYLRLGNYEQAIEYLKKFDGEDIIVSTMAIGLIGDAYSELGNDEEALDYYEKASKHNENKFTTPYFLMKSATTAERLGDFEKAFNNYTKIQKEYPESTEARDIEKYIERAKAHL